MVYARVSSRAQVGDVDRQVARVCRWATDNGLAVDDVVTEVGSAVSGKGRKFRRLLADSGVGTIVVEHRDRLVRFGFE